MLARQHLSLIMILVILLTVVGFLTYHFGRSLWVPMIQKIVGKRSVEDVMALYGDAALSRLKARFDAARATWPPQSVMLLAIKDQATLELWAETAGEKSLIHIYPILAASGKAGPKLREGDKQVPEGVYAITTLNPNSAYHLSMKLDYPNAFDREHAQADGRTDLGGNIFIHGKDRSIGCLAMGDEAIEELFAMTVICDIGNVKIAIAPSDPRIAPFHVSDVNWPTWISDLYDMLNEHFKHYPQASSFTTP